LHQQISKYSIIIPLYAILMQSSPSTAHSNLFFVFLKSQLKLEQNGFTWVRLYFCYRNQNQHRTVKYPYFFSCYQNTRIKYPKKVIKLRLYSNILHQAQYIQISFLWDLELSKNWNKMILHGSSYLFYVWIHFFSQKTVSELQLHSNLLKPKGTRQIRVFFYLDI
jgi:hypothetical protein